MMLERGSKIGIVGCSNGQLKTYEEKIKRLLEVIRELGLEPVCSEYLYERDSYFSGTGKERADALNAMYADKEIKAIFDISGGDVANEVLEYLDYDLITSTDKMFFGYSDLTTVINAIYSITGKSSGLYQIRNLIYDDAEKQILNFKNTFLNNKNDLNEFKYYFIQENYMEGEIVGGNIRCFLKLAGTKYMPVLDEKILLLEGLNASSQQAVTYLSQLRHMGVFEKINGILLGTFTKLDAEIFVPSIEELVQKYAGKDIPIARTMEIGHGSDSKCIIVGNKMRFES